MSSTGPTPAAPLPYIGPERRRRAGALPRLLSALLDEVDSGMVVLTADGRALHLNHAAHDDLAQQHALLLDDGRLAARRPEDAHRLQAALRSAAQSHKRSLLHLWHDEVDHPVSVMPLPSPDEAAAGAPVLVLVKLGRRALAGGLAVAAYGRANGLSMREQEVLQALCDGLRPGAVAERLHISLATVRTHIQNLRKKAGVPDITTLIHQVAKLPPMQPAIKNGGGTRAPDGP